MIHIGWENLRRKEEVFFHKYGSIGSLCKSDNLYCTDWFNGTLINIILENENGKSQMFYPSFIAN